jgi:hypothetical protein
VPEATLFGTLWGCADPIRGCPLSGLTRDPGAARRAPTAFDSSKAAQRQADVRSGGHGLGDAKATEVYACRQTLSPCFLVRVSTVVFAWVAMVLVAMSAIAVAMSVAVIVAFAGDVQMGTGGCLWSDRIEEAAGLLLAWLHGAASDREPSKRALDSAGQVHRVDVRVVSEPPADLRLASVRWGHSEGPDVFDAWRAANSLRDLEGIYPLRRPCHEPAETSPQQV